MVKHAQPALKLICEKVTLPVLQETAIASFMVNQTQNETEGIEEVKIEVGEEK